MIVVPFPCYVYVQGSLDDDLTVHWKVNSDVPVHRWRGINRLFKSPDPRNLHSIPENETEVPVTTNINHLLL